MERERGTAVEFLELLLPCRPERSRGGREDGAEETRGAEAGFVSARRVVGGIALEPGREREWENVPACSWVCEIDE